MLQDNATVGHCVVCGRRDRWQLCRRCLKQYSDENGVLHPAVLALRQMQQQQAVRNKRSRERIQLVPLYHAE